MPQPPCKILRLQRMQQHNTQRDPEVNAFIQQETIALYDKYIEGNALNIEAGGVIKTIVHSFFTLL